MKNNPIIGDINMIAKNHRKKPANTVTINDIRKYMSKHNPIFIHISTSDLFKMLTKHGLKSVNEYPINGVGKYHYFYDKNLVAKLLELDAVIQYAKNYNPRNKKHTHHNSTKREVSRTLPTINPVKFNADEIELVSIEYINKILNKPMTVDTLAKNGLTPVAKIVNEFGAVSFAYSKKDFDNTNLDSNMLDLSKLSKDQINAIKMIASIK